MEFYKRKTLLVTGATGLIGSHLIKRLLEIEDVYVIALSRDERKMRNIFCDYLSNRCFSMLEHDISVELPKFERGIDFIFHAASPISGNDIIKQPVNVIKTNIIGTQNCLDFLVEQRNCLGVKGKLVVFSSATVYSNLSDNDCAFSEKDTTTVESLESLNAPYFESKRMVEVMAKAYFNQYKIDSVIVRCSYVYGYSYYNPNTAFFEFLENACLGKDIVIKNNNMPRRDNIYVDDVVRGLLYLCAYGDSAESYNLSSNAEKGNFLAVDEMAEIVATVVNRVKKSAVRVIYETTPKGERRAGSILDNSKIKKVGWRLETTIEQGIEKTIDAYLAEERNEEKRNV